MEAQIDPGLASSCDTVAIMESYFIIITDFSDAIYFKMHTLWHKPNKTNSAFIDPAIIF